MFAPSSDGLYDLAGNTWEWCDSIYEDKEHYRVMRGGSWRYADPMFSAPPAHQEATCKKIACSQGVTEGK